MSTVAEYKALEAQIAENTARLESLKNDSKLKKELEFESKLRGLLGEYGYSLRDVIGLLDPSAKSARQSTAVKASRRERVLKRYKNPNSGELLETKGGNNRVLKAWKQEFGAEIVESWLQ